MKYYLCVEDGEFFSIQAESIEQAREDASVYNAQVIRELTAAEVESGEVSI